MSIRLNTAYNLAGAVVPLAVAIITVPLYLEVIGIERYGVISLFWVLLGYFGLFDFGLGRSVSQRLAALSQAGAAERSEVFWTGLFISVAISVLGMALLVPVSGLVLHLVKLETSEVSAEIVQAVPLLAITLPITLVGSIFSGALVGRERFAQVNLVESLSNVLITIAPLALAWWLGPALPNLIAGSLVIRVVSTLILFWICRREVPLLRPSAPRGPVVKGMLHYGGWVTVQSAVGSLIATWDRFVIGAVLNAGAVSIYVIPSNLVTRLLIIPQALTRAVFPRMAQGTDEEAVALSVRSLYALALLLTLPTIGLIAMVEPLMRLWVGVEIATQSAPVAKILLPAVYANGFGLVMFFYLQARGRPAVTAKLHLAEFVPYLALLVMAIKIDGVRGAALAWSVRTIIDAGLLAWLARLKAEPARHLTGIFLLVALSALVALMLPFWSLLYWLLQLALFATAAFLSWNFAPASATNLVWSLLGRFRQSRGPQADLDTRAPRHTVNEVKS